MIHLWATPLLTYASSAVTTRDRANCASDATLMRYALLASQAARVRYALSASSASDRSPVMLASTNETVRYA
jgi:hypothetical protein